MIEIKFHELTDIACSGTFLQWNYIMALSGCGPGTVLGIATGYGVDVPGIESRWGRDIPYLSRPALGPTLDNGYRLFPGGKERPGRDADPSPPSSAVVKKE